MIWPYVEEIVNNLPSKQFKWPATKVSVVGNTIQCQSGKINRDICTFITPFPVFPESSDRCLAKTNIGPFCALLQCSTAVWTKHFMAQKGSYPFYTCTNYTSNFLLGEIVPKSSSRKKVVFGVNFFFHVICCLHSGFLHSSSNYIWLLLVKLIV